MATRDVMRRESLPSIFHDFFKPWDRWFDTNGGSMSNMMTVPAVNIVEKQDHYEISLAAPGMKKDDFNIDVEGNLLTISAESEQKREEKDERHTRQEFNYTSFSRAFTGPPQISSFASSRRAIVSASTCAAKARSMSPKSQSALVAVVTATPAAAPSTVPSLRQRLYSSRNCTTPAVRPAPLC